jgi:hypothetical protein
MLFFFVGCVLMLIFVAIRGWVRYGFTHGCLEEFFVALALLYVPLQYCLDRWLGRLPWFGGYMLTELLQHNEDASDFHAIDLVACIWILVAIMFIFIYR